VKLLLAWSLVLALVSPVAAVPPTMIHWRRTGPPVAVTVYDRTADALWGTALHRAVAEWNAGIEGVELSFSPGPADCEKGQGPYTVVVCIRENTAPDRVGETTVYSSDGEHISQATIWMDPRSDPNRNHLACHELGHALGLGHRGANENSCMTNGPYKRPEHPDRRDFDTVTLRHAHVH